MTDAQIKQLGGTAFKNALKKKKWGHEKGLPESGCSQEAKENNTYGRICLSAFSDLNFCPAFVLDADRNQLLVNQSIPD